MVLLINMGQQTKTQDHCCTHGTSSDISTLVIAVGRKASVEAETMASNLLVQCKMVWKASGGSGWVCCEAVIQKFSTGFILFWGPSDQSGSTRNKRKNILLLWKSVLLFHCIGPSLFFWYPLVPRPQVLIVSTRLFLHSGCGDKGSHWPISSLQ